jgi:hypothetical protein
VLFNRQARAERQEQTEAAKKVQAVQRGKAARMAGGLADLARDAGGLLRVDTAALARPPTPAPEPEPEEEPARAVCAADLLSRFESSAAGKVPHPPLPGLFISLVILHATQTGA